MPGGAGAGAANSCAIAYRGVVTTSAATTLTVQYAQNTADVSDLVIQAGSHLSYRKAS
jgi:hypothetical protein